MSNEKQETIADIVAALRAVAYIQNADSPRNVLEFANRIEAAAKREREATREKSSQVGNSAKLREACEALMSEIGGYLTDGLEVIWCSISGKTIKKARAALSDNPRNCDVGTEDEQSERFDAHCRKHMGCLTCPLREKDGGVPKHCELAWAQLPYEEGCAK